MAGRAAYSVHITVFRALGAANTIPDACCLALSYLRTACGFTPRFNRKPPVCWMVSVALGGMGPPYVHQIRDECRPVAGAAIAECGDWCQRGDAACFPLSSLPGMYSERTCQRFTPPAHYALPKIRQINVSTNPLFLSISSI